MSVPTCNHALGGVNSRTGLLCILPADHPGNGHVYRSGHGSEVPDRHTATEAVEE